MQIVVALPSATAMKRLETTVCGVPLLTRVIATAVRAGGSELLLVIPPGWPPGWLTNALRFVAIEAVVIRTVKISGSFDPSDSEAWRRIEDQLDERFLWLPYDYLAYRPALVELLATAASHPGSGVRFSPSTNTRAETPVFEQPAVLLKWALLDGATGSFVVAAQQGEPGLSTRPPATVRDLEAELVRRSGKVTDGMYSNFNRKLCRPAVRWLAHTWVTANEVSFGGLAAGVVAAICFAQGAWAWDIAGAALFFISGLFDEMDGMLARLKFQESNLGCWLETFIDYATYLLAFAGMTVGGYQRGGSVYVAVGAALLIGSLLCFFTISVQRKLAAAAEPTEYYKRYLKALDRDAANPISKLTRNLQFLLRKGVLIHYVLLFAVLNQMRVLLFLAAFGANVAWIVTLYLNRRLFLTNKTVNQRPAAVSPAQMEVGR